MAMKYFVVPPFSAIVFAYLLMGRPDHALPAALVMIGWAILMRDDK